MVYYPASNPNSTTVLNANTTGSGQIGALDTTTLVNGSYWIQLWATDTSGDFQFSLVQVTVAGTNKPGRVTTTVTDLIVPATGLAINIQRNYDSLNDATVGDFGYGWNLSMNVNLAVDPAGNVSFTLNGKRKTFYLTPQTDTSPLLGQIFPWWNSVFTPEPGLYGTLSSAGTGCNGGLSLEFLIPDGNSWGCVGGFPYSPTTYVYTDPNGTAYTISASGQLKSIQDRVGNGQTITANGIISTTGISVPFVRDAQNRITKITDPQGNIYQYQYDTNGNLAFVTYPSTTSTSVICGIHPSNYIFSRAMTV
jgi:YD repeat-containing protein